MKRWLSVLLLALSIFLFQSNVQAQSFVTLDSTTLRIDTVKTGLDIPWEIHWGQDGWLWMTERYGRVSRLNPDNGTQDVILDLSSTVYESGETGLLGLTLHPDFPDSNKVYLVYTYLDNSSVEERLVMYEYDGNDLVNPTTIIEDIPGFNTHVGSRLLITPDRKLIMTTGDAQDQPSAQDLNDLTGKLFRFNLDGSIPSDNPISGSPIWSWGHRNAQGLAIGPGNRIYSSEHGPSNDDELNILEVGRNYGWPTVQGFCDSPPENAFCADSNVYEPLIAWTPTLAVSDLIWYNHPMIPEWENKLLMTTLKERDLRVMTLDGAGTAITNEETELNNMFGRYRDIAMAPDGRIFIATNGPSWTNTQPFTHNILVITNPNFAAPLEVTSSVDTVSACPGDTLDLESYVSVSGGTAPYTYQWNPATLIADSSREYTLTVTDAGGATSSGSIFVSNASITEFSFSYYDLLDNPSDSLSKRLYVVVEYDSLQNVTVFSTSTGVTFNLNDSVFVSSHLRCKTACGWADTVCVSTMTSCGTQVVECQFVAVSINSSSVPELSALSNIQLYPNPATNQLNLQASFDRPTDLRATLFDLTGRVLSSYKMLQASGQVNQSIDVSPYTNGLYVMRIDVGGEAYYQKVLIQH